MSVERLQAVLPKPIRKLTQSNNWDSVESKLGPLPQDYKDFVDFYGLGRIDRFLMIYSPFVEGQYANLVTRGEMDLA